MFKKAFKLIMTASLLCAVLPYALIFADESIQKMKRDVIEARKPGAWRPKRIIEVPEVVIGPQDTVVTITEKGLLRDVVYTVPVRVSE